MVKYLVFCVFVVASYVVYFNFPVDRDPGIMIESAPDIGRITWQEPFVYNGAKITPKKVIEGEVLIIKKKRYYFDDLTKYTPVDAIVGWNELSDTRNLDFIYYSLSDRSFDLALTRPPVPLNAIHAKSELWHLIPSTSAISEKVKALRDGHIIYVKGLIVDLEIDSNTLLSSNTEQRSSKNPEGIAVWIEDFRIR